METESIETIENENETKYILTVLFLSSKQNQPNNINFIKLAKICSSFPSWRVIIDDNVVVKLEKVKKERQRLINYIEEIDNLIKKNNGFIRIFDQDEFTPLIDQNDNNDFYNVYTDKTNFNEYIKIIILYLFLILIYYIYFSG